jgi:hypothetical protein
MQNRTSDPYLVAIDRIVTDPRASIFPRACPTTSSSSRLRQPAARLLLAYCMSPAILVVGILLERTQCVGLHQLRGRQPQQHLHDQHRLGRRVSLPAVAAADHQVMAFHLRVGYFSCQEAGSWVKTPHAKSLDLIKARSSEEHCNDEKTYALHRAACNAAYCHPTEVIPTCPKP